MAFSAGQLGHLAEHDSLHTLLASAGLGTLGSAHATANQTGIGTSDTDVTGLSKAVTVGTSRRIRISVQLVVNSNNVNLGTVSIKEGATLIHSVQLSFNAIGDNRLFTPWIDITPSSGAHTYKVTVAFNAGTGATIAAATSPAQLLIEDVGL